MSGVDGDPARSRPTGLARWSVGQVLGLSIGVLLAIAVVALALAFVATQRLSDRRHALVDSIDPALTLALGLENALLNQETGVRGYVLSGEPRFLQPDRLGRREEARSYAELGRLDPGGTTLTADVGGVRTRARAWRSGFAAGAVASPRSASSAAAEARGKALFDAVRESLARLRANLLRQRVDGRRALDDAANRLLAVLAVAAGLILASVVGAGLLLRRLVSRPLGRLGERAEEVASGRFDAPIASGGGPREIVQVESDVERMRARIVAELATVESARARIERQAVDLARSNADLEQFAYVASHDLQEPLRKVASFSQILERRYHGQIDERADEYIGFIVDGAHRMQRLISDLLALSRVGRQGAEPEPLDAGDLVAEACRALAGRLAEADGRVEAAGLPTVRGERSLLVALFQNLIGNAVKFRGAEPPLVRITARAAGPDWEFSCRDNGIGVAPEFAERIFLIFQRLHSRDAYEGTGIGLALCRKVVEFHGGRIWLDATEPRGACFRFTLPRPDAAPR